MSKKIVAISGGENGRLLKNGKFSPYETELMDKEIIKLTAKGKPNFLFLGHSQSSSLEIQEGYFQTMKNIYQDKFGCVCKDLKSNELDDIKVVKEKIDWADIIYEGGGDTPSMIKLWQQKGFDKILKDAWNKGKVICGISAGAICWFKACNSDFIDNNELSFEDVSCLNWFNAHFTPHCDEKGRYESAKEQLKENNLVGLLLSNCSALEIIDNKYRIITSDSKWHEIKKAYGIKAYWENDKFIEEKIKISNNFEDLEKLINK